MDTKPKLTMDELVYVVSRPPGTFDKNTNPDIKPDGACRSIRLRGEGVGIVYNMEVKKEGVFETIGLACYNRAGLVFRLRNFQLNFLQHAGEPALKNPRAETDFDMMMKFMSSLHQHLNYAG